MPIVNRPLSVPKPFQSGIADVAFVFCIWAAIILGSIRKSRLHALWFDELLAFNLISDPSLPHMLKALGDQVDGGAPLYYIIGWFLAKMFGNSETALRLYPAVCICCGATVLWYVIRRTFPLWACAIALSSALGTSLTVRVEMANVRFYGLLFALVCIVFLIAEAFIRNERPNKRLMIVNTIANGALVLTHPFGICYSGLVMLGVVVVDWAKGRRQIRPKIILSYVVAWLFIILWLKQFIRQSDVNNPYTWVPSPGYFELLTSMDAAGNYSCIVLLVAVIFLFRRSGESSRTDTRQEDAMTILALSCLAIIPIFWLFSLLVPSHSIFLPRYFIGCVPAWVVILASLSTKAGDPPRIVRVGSILLSLVMLGPLASKKKPGLFHRHVEVAGTWDEIVGHTNLPILVLQAQDYLMRQHYSPNASRYFYPLDWEVATDRNNKSNAPTLYKIMAALPRNYPRFRNIIELEDFLAREKTFLVYPVYLHWASLRLPPSDYDVQHLSTVQQGVVMHMLLARKRPP